MRLQQTKRLGWNLKDNVRGEQQWRIRASMNEKGIKNIRV